MSRLWGLARGDQRGEGGERDTTSLLELVEELTLAVGLVLRASYGDFGELCVLDMSAWRRSTTGSSWCAARRSLR